MDFWENWGFPFLVSSLLILVILSQEVSFGRLDNKVCIQQDNRWMCTSEVIVEASHNWSSVPKWADIGFYGQLGWKELEFQLGFLMDNYQIISIEKCSGPGGHNGRTEENFVNLVSQMRNLRPNSSSQILNYWSVIFRGQFKCYEAQNALLAREDLWLKDDLGNIAYEHNTKKLPQYDFRIEESRTLWIQGALDPVIKTNGGSNGVFLDGVEIRNITNCHMKTCGADKASCCIFSPKSEAAFHEGIKLAVSGLREKIHDLDPTYVLIGNGLFNYDFNSGKGNPTYTEFVDILDGFCFEHFMAFEGTHQRATKPPFINIKALENSIKLSNLLVEKNKYVFIRSLPGPVGSPINLVGGLSTPSLPEHYPYPKPLNNLEVQQAMKDLFSFPLAVYLCCFANNKVYYTYSVWYDVRQSVPSLENPTGSQFPLDFDEYLKMNPGPPLEEPNWEGRVCSRRFTNFMITVDLEDDNSAAWSNT